MGRTRKHNPLGLDPKKHIRLYPKHGAFYYFHRDGRWEHLGTDLAEAKRKAALYNDPDSTFGTMAHWLDLFVVHCEKRVARHELAQRTYEDYKRDVEPLKVFFGRMTPASVEQKHVARYLDAGAELGRPVRANREKACLSTCFTWLVRLGDAGVKANPCTGVRRNKETPRERYVEHDEYGAVYKIAARPVQILMELIYRTLQRPEDVITWTRANIVAKREGEGTKRVLRNQQGKTGAIVDIEITPELDAVLQSALNGSVPSISKPLVHTRKGEAYTYSGLTSMLQRYTTTARLTAFGFYDLKAKGATDMWLAGVPLEQIQVLCGHESVTTTEIYVKCRWRGTVQPNSLPILSNKTG